MVINVGGIHDVLDNNALPLRRRIRCSHTAASNLRIRKAVDSPARGQFKTEGRKQG